MKQTRYDILLLAMIALICVSPTHTEPLADSSAVATPLDSATAVQRAIEFTGFSVAAERARTKYPRLTIMKESQLGRDKEWQYREPLISAVLLHVDSVGVTHYDRETHGAGVWRIRFDSLFLRRGEACGRGMTVNIYLRESDGMFLLATKWPGSEQPDQRAIVRGIASCLPTFVQEPGFSFEGYIDTPLPKTLSDAYTLHFIRPCGAKRSLALLVKYRKRDGSTFPAWLLVSLDMPAVFRTRPGAPARACRGGGINANTGVGISGLLSFGQSSCPPIE